MREIVSPLDGFLSPFGRISGSGGAAFSPASLFAIGEDGAWYEPSTTTCFTDTAGTTAAGVGDAVARINDLSGNGNHATQATSSARPILARVPETGRRNLLERTEEFDDAYWTKADATVSSNAGTAPDGTTTADKVIVNSGRPDGSVRRAFSFVGGTSYALSVYAKVVDTGFDVIAFTVEAQAAINFNLTTLSPTITAELNGWTITSPSIESVGSGWYRCSAVFNAATTVTQNARMAEVRETGDGTSGILFWGAQLEAASTATAYQKVVDQYDITEAGVTSLEYLAFDGSGDGMATASIDFTATDKMSVFAGVEKESETATAVLFELSSTIDTNQGSFLAAVNTASGSHDWYAASRGSASLGSTLDVNSDDSQAAQVVNTTLHDISGDSTVLRLDGAQIDVATGDKGTGNFGNYPLNIGARSNAASLWFDGKLFSLIVRGAASTAQEISDTESYVAAKTGVTIP